MKRLLLILSLFAIPGFFTYSQQVNIKNATASQVVKEQGFTMQIGVPVLGTDLNKTERTTTPIDVRFPWDIFYQYQTFANESFEVSKGYFGDKVRLNWEFRNNQDRISSVKIFRRRYSSTIEQPYQLLANRPGNTTEFEDQFSEGGVLYEYKVFAEGILETEMPFVNFITGLGFRSPTATVTGNISFEGGNPVKDVSVLAEPTGAAISVGSAVQIPQDGSVVLNLIRRPIDNAVTFQAWVKPLGSGTTKLMNLSHFEERIEASFETDSEQKKLTVWIDGSVFELNNYLPAGQTDARGNEVLLPIEQFSEQFTHFSILLKEMEMPQLFLNGRRIDGEYARLVNTPEKMLDASYRNAPMAITANRQATQFQRDATPVKWQYLGIGGDSPLIVDEIRVWNTLLDSAMIRQDYRRFISGNHASLISYIRADEGDGRFAYDLSRTGFDYNKNDLQLFDVLTSVALRPAWVRGGGNIPNSNQLGVMGITNSNGNYEINAIPYTGNGESFNITPIFGQHRFDPGAQMVFLGRGSEVVNKIDFKDISSFIFRGRILFDTRGVFPSFVETNGGSFDNLTDGIEYVTNPGITDEGYNYYEKGGLKYFKGRYWYNDNGTPDDADDDYLEEYATISPSDVQILVDGQVVLGPNRQPVKPNSKGEFEIRVPIGDHFVTVEKQGHHFLHAGRFPAEEGVFKEFFEDAAEAVYFVDTTRVTVVGKVVGGSIEGEKQNGFGSEGKLVKTYVDTDGIEKEVLVSAKNNIGKADLVLEHRPGGSPATEETRMRFSTHPESGEYRVQVLPLQYQINQLTGLRIPSNPSLSLLTSNEDLNFENIVPQIIPEFTLPNQQVIFGSPFQYQWNFVHRTAPVLRVLGQTYDQTVDTSDSTSISTEGLPYPIYTQFRDYLVELSNFERYINYDNEEEIEDQVPVMDGEMVVNNNLAMDNSEFSERDVSDPSIIHYSFKAGPPSLSP
nr:laminin G [Cytophagales bacterium]